MNNIFNQIFIGYSIIIYDSNVNSKRCLAVILFDLLLLEDKSPHLRKINFLKWGFVNYTGKAKVMEVYISCVISSSYSIL
jgi:hypothetical protein